MRKKLIVHNWLELSKSESNPTQTLDRLEKQSTRAIRDLILLAEKLPENSQKEIFAPGIIDELIRAILHRGDTYPIS